MNSDGAHAHSDRRIGRVDDSPARDGVYIGLASDMPASRGVYEGQETGLNLLTAAIPMVR